MAIISEISIQKNNPDRYNLFLDGEFYCGVGADTIGKYHLYRSREIDEQTLEAIALNEFRQYFLRRASAFALKGFKTEKGIRDYVKKLLYKKELLNEIFGENIVVQIDKENLVDWVAHEIKELKLIDDVDYAKEFASDRLLNRPRGKKMIEFELMQKGVKKEDIKSALENVEIDEKSMIADLLQKRYHKSRLTHQDQKEINYLRSKGFDWDQISSFLDD